MLLIGAVSAKLEKNTELTLGHDTRSLCSISYRESLSEKIMTTKGPVSDLCLTQRLILVPTMLMMSTVNTRRAAACMHREL